MKIIIILITLSYGIMLSGKAQFLVKNTLKTGVDYEISVKTPFPKEGYKLIEQDKKVGFLKYNDDYTEEGSIILPQFDEANEFNYGWSIVKLNGKYGAIDINGMLVLPIIFQKAERSQSNFTNKAELELNGEKMVYDFKSKEMVVNNKLKELETTITKENEDNQKIRYEMNKMYEALPVGSAEQKKWEPIINLYTEIVNYNALIKKQAKHYIYKNGMQKINKYNPAPDLLEELKEREEKEKPASKLKLNSMLNAFAKESDEYKQLSKKIAELSKLDTDFNAEKLLLKL